MDPEKARRVTTRCTLVDFWTPSSDVWVKESAMFFPDRSIEFSSSGTDLAVEFRHLSGNAREDFVFQQVVNGNVPDFMRMPVTIQLGINGMSAQLDVAPDYLCLGTNESYFYAQCNIATAQRIADICDAMLPTSRIVDEIWKQATVRMGPKPWGPPYDATMFSSERLLNQSTKLLMQRQGYENPLGELTAGHFKDYILVPRMAQKKDRTCIYGWHKRDGNPIQPVQLDFHELTYVDYSQCPRLISKRIIVDGVIHAMSEVMASSRWSVVLKNGPSDISRVPAVPQP